METNQPEAGQGIVQNNSFDKVGQSRGRIGFLFWLFASVSIILSLWVIGLDTILSFAFCGGPLKCTGSYIYFFSIMLLIAQIVAIVFWRQNREIASGVSFILAGLAVITYMVVEGTGLYNEEGIYMLIRPLLLFIPGGLALFVGVNQKRLLEKGS